MAKSASSSAAAPRRTGKRPSRSIAELRERLERLLPQPECELDHRGAWQLLVATILSAQSTDKMVNRVTPVLFERYPTPAALAQAPQDDVESVVKSTGFFRNKAKAIRETSRQIVERFGGEVPRTLAEMLTLRGVARKTANVVLGTAYGVPSGFVVDTHVGRVARRLALTKHSDPVKVETDLCKVFPNDVWVDMGHRLVLHGRYVCLARKPICVRCPLNELCPSAEAPPTGEWTERADWEHSRIRTRGAEPLETSPPEADASPRWATPKTRATSGGGPRKKSRV